MRFISILMIASLLTGCATTLDSRGRVEWGVATGAVAGAVGGAALSPNSESRGLNALVFGLAGALIGGLIGFFSGAPSKHEDRGQNLEMRDKASNTSHEIQTPAGDGLPEFVKERFRPAVIEEFTEQDSISEDGSLSEPHKVYRIKRPAELVPKPVSQDEKQ